MLPAALTRFSLGPGRLPFAFATSACLLAAGPIYDWKKRGGEYLKPAAYEAAGRVTIAHSDLLIAIWDGDEGDTGGTGADDDGSAAPRHRHAD